MWWRLSSPESTCDRRTRIERTRCSQHHSMARRPMRVGDRGAVGTRADSGSGAAKERRAGRSRGADAVGARDRVRRACGKIRRGSRRRRRFADGSRSRSAGPPTQATSTSARFGGSAPWRADSARRTLPRSSVAARARARDPRGSKRGSTSECEMRSYARFALRVDAPVATRGSRYSMRVGRDA